MSEIRDLYIRTYKGLPYQFAYLYPEETEEQAKKAIQDRFDYPIEFISKEEFYS